MLKDWVIDYLGHDFHKKCLGKSLRIQRENLGISMRGMAKVLDISSAYMSDIERGYRRINKQLSKAYTDELLKHMRIQS